MNLATYTNLLNLNKEIRNMIYEEGEVIISGTEKGLTAYLRREQSSVKGIVYCVSEDSTEDDHREIAELVQRRRLPIVVVSSWEVYPEGIDEVLYENSHVSPDTDFGRKCAEAEKIVSTAANAVGTACAIIRPGMMFGTDIGGEGERMFKEVISSRWFGIRQVTTERSIVCALDVARVAMSLIGRSGIWNVSDGRKSGLTQLAASMSANTGLNKRPIVFPLPVAKIIARLADALPFLNRGWDSKHLKQKLTSRVLDTSSLAKTLPEMKFYNTLAVIARTDESYPYESK